RPVSRQGDFPTLRNPTAPLAPATAALNTKPLPVGRSWDARHGGAGAASLAASSLTGCDVHGTSGLCAGAPRGSCEPPHPAAATAIAATRMGTTRAGTTGIAAM